LLEKYVLSKIFFVRKYDNLFETKKKDIEIGYFGETFVSGTFLECCLQGFDKI
jgi:hypothetical protein